MKHKSQTEQKLIFNSMDEKATQERALKFFGGVARDAERIVAILKQMNQSTVVVRDFYAFMDKLGESDKNATVANFNKAIKLLARPENGFVVLPTHCPEFFSANGQEVIEVHLDVVNSGRPIVPPQYVMQRVDVKEKQAVDTFGKHGTGFEDRTSMLHECCVCGKPVDTRRQVVCDRLYHFGCLKCDFCGNVVLDVFPGVAVDKKVGHPSCVAEAGRKPV